MPGALPHHCNRIGNGVQCLTHRNNELKADCQGFFPVISTNSSFVFRTPVKKTLKTQYRGIYMVRLMGYKWDCSQFVPYLLDIENTVT